MGVKNGTMGAPIQKQRPLVDAINPHERNLFLLRWLISCYFQDHWGKNAFSLLMEMIGYLPFLTLVAFEIDIIKSWVQI